MNLTTNGGRVLLGVVTAFTAMAGAVLGLSLASWIGPSWVGLGLLVALTSVGAMIGAGSVEYLRRVPFLTRVMAAAGVAGLLFPIPVLSIVPFAMAFPVLCLLIGGSVVWVDVSRTRATGWEG